MLPEIEPTSRAAPDGGNWIQYYAIWGYFVLKREHLNYPVAVKHV